MLKNSFSARETPFEFVTVLLSMIDADGNKIYHYLAIKEQDVENFRNAIRAGKPYDVRDYGAVLESGFDQPDDKVKEKMTKLYGCNHNSVVTIG